MERTGIVGLVPLYDISGAIHVTAAIVGFGATFTYSVIQIVAEQTNRHALPFATAVLMVVKPA
jgi:pyrroline-5-carboxylate reductase